MTGEHVARPTLPEKVCTRAAELLSRHVGKTVAVVGQEILNHDGHAFVARVLLDDGSPLASAVVKMAHRGDGGEFDKDDADPYGPAARLWNEWAGLEFLSSLPTPCTAVPAFYGGDAALGFVVMEDLGAGPSLANLLLGTSAEQARAGLDGYVDALAEVHLATFGRTEAYDDLRSRLGTTAPAHHGFSAAKCLGDLTTPLGILDPTIDLDGDVAEAVAWIDAVLDDPGPWRAFSLNDCCPDNNRVDERGRLRLFDVEFADARHALLDVAYLRTTMPTCWCVRRLVPDLAEDLVQRYRDRLAAGGRATSDADFHAALNACAAFWALLNASWHLEAALEPTGADRSHWDAYDFTFGSRRQIFLQRLAELADAADRQPELAALRSRLADPARAAARRAWQVVDPLPLYPAFAAGKT
ncbi:hypothetical protein ABN034_13230 [Actinopolymorpha sp. B11F2]|uniref:hypothetical protein n=1 Tax=Actinopolymorpha sp. B11F2 TaxID=3160862 RepID=UPI0032E4982E